MGTLFLADVGRCRAFSPEDNITNLFSNYTELKLEQVENALAYN